MNEQLPATLEFAVLALVMEAERPVARPRSLLDLILTAFAL